MNWMPQNMPLDFGNVLKNQIHGTGNILASQIDPIQGFERMEKNLDSSSRILQDEFFKKNPFFKRFE